MLQMFENQYKTDFHGLTSGPARVPGDFSAVVLAQGSGSCSKTAPQTLQLFTLPLWKFTPLLLSGGSQLSCLLGNSSTRFLVLLQSRPSRQGDCHRLNWHGFKPGDLEKKKPKKRTERKKKISYTELFCMPEDREQNMQIVALWSLQSCHCLQPALLTSPVNTSHFTTTSALLFYSPFKTAASLWFLPVGASICTPACICAPLLV